MAKKKLELTLPVEVVAEIVYEANRVYCNSIGDTSQVVWAEAPDWQKDSAIQGVKFRLDNPRADAAKMHKNWLDTKMAEGWRYGPVKNPETKEHPCMMAYDFLPEEQKYKDTLFKSIVSALAVKVDVETEPADNGEA